MRRLFLAAALLSAAAAAAPITEQALTVAGTIDGQPFTCRAASNFSWGKDTSSGLIESSFVCNGTQRVYCQPQQFRYTFQNVALTCFTNPPTGAFAAVHDPQLTTITPGTSATLLVQVYNDTGKALTNVTVGASAAPACAHASTSMASGAVLSYTCPTPVLQQDITDTITASGTDANGAHYTANAAAAVQVDGPRIAFTVSPAAQNVVKGNAATWQVMVANAGPQTLSSWILADQQSASNCAATFASMAPATTSIYPCDVPNVQASFTDKFSASAMNGTSPLVVDRTVTVNAVTDTIFKNGFQ